MEKLRQTLRNAHELVDSIPAESEIALVSGPTAAADVLITLALATAGARLSTCGCTRSTGSLPI